MAFVVARPNGTWELRRSRNTAAGPRSETLVSFRELTTDAITRAISRSEGSLTPDQIKAAALRAGAPTAVDAAPAAAAALIRELVGGAELPKSWKQPLAALLSGSTAENDRATALAEWGAAGADRHGEALYDLLLLADAVPARRQRGALAFPGLVTADR